MRSYNAVRETLKPLRMQIAGRDNTMKESYMDAAQGIAIIAVVCGTVLERIDDAGFLQDGRVAHLLVMIQYAVCTFGYPCFFFLFGVKAVESLGRAQSRWGFVKMTLFALVYPYLLWSMLQMGVQWLVAQHTHHPFPLEEFGRPAWAPVDQFWFLYALCVCQLLAWVTVRKTPAGRQGIFFAIGRALLVLLAVVCAALATRTSWGIVTMTLWGLTFFLAGMLVGQRCNLWMARAVGVPMLLVAVVVFAGTVKLGQSVGGYMNASSLPAAFAGIVTTLLVATRLTGQGHLRWLTTLGAAWMPIYLLHFLATGLVWNGLLAGYVTSPVAHFVAGVVAGVAIPFAVYRLTKRLRIARLAGFDLVDLAERTEARQVALAHYRARLGIDQSHG